MELTPLEIKVLEAIKPREEEYKLLLGTYERVASAVEAALRRHGITAEVTLQGSVAHDTWLSGDRDLDVFVLFPENWSREDLEKKALPILLEAAQQLGTCELMYAEHPYVRLRTNGVEVDLVPGLKLRDPREIKTAVDRTPFHTMYISRALTREQRDHVRLLKKFMKAIGVYGAEVKTRGFSGYAVELLVGVFGSFRGVIENASRWKPPVYVDTLGGGLTRQLKDTLARKYPDSCMYMPDPVDPERNVTANVSLKSLATFIIASKCYLRNPGLEFFEEPPEPSISELLKASEGRCLVFLVYNLREKLPPDVVWGEAQRVSLRLYRLLEVLGVKPVDYSAWTDESEVAVVAVELETCRLPNYKHYRGPCIAHEDNRIHGFISKHAGSGYGPWITDDGCLESLDPRGTVDVAEVIESKWMEYTVAPHFRTVKPAVYTASKDLFEEIAQRGGGRWLRSFLVKAPHWMVKCTS
ncbi:MAG: CCA tRNA nucleotidyltransferase [Desulfurococcaceae archaeon]